MSLKKINLPIFPLSVFLLPGGITRLRIFEPKYLTMVSLSSQLGGFILCKENNGFHWGSWVEIINFNQDSHGVLEIDIQCKALVKITSTYSDDSKLTFAEAHTFEHWSTNQSSNASAELTDSLNDVIEKHALLKTLYQNNLSDNPYWVVSRWLELLPIDYNTKSRFIDDSTYAEAKQLVHSVIF